MLLHQCAYTLVYEDISTVADIDIIIIIYYYYHSGIIIIIAKKH